MSMSVEKWLGLPDDKLAVELGKVFTREDECRHDWVDVILRMPGLCNLKYKCTRCALHVAVKADFGCVPDPIKVDWNTAKYWQGKCDQILFFTMAIAVKKKAQSAMWAMGGVTKWLAHLHKPEHARLILIIAAIAVERNKK